ncbi:hypothetical protein DMA11_22355 [Marinilabiliaceae bacterium JC017]|nr:hypothetical protein DMA11_22355 [Marinilabiliaceae bacterium JC017]
MYDFFKPNSGWRKIAQNLGGGFVKGNVLTPTKMTIDKNGLTFFIKTSYSSDNSWSARTIISCPYHYKKEFSLKIYKNFWTVLMGHSAGILIVPNKFSSIKRILINNRKLNDFRREYKSFQIIFKTEGIITESYEVLPMLQFKTNKYIRNQHEFEKIIELMSDLSRQLEKENIINSAPNLPQ